MSFNPSEFYEFASWMNSMCPKSGVKQSVARSIISRAYYSALLHSRDVTGEQTSGGHVKVIEGIKQRSTSVGNKLHALKMLRQKADYEVADVTQLQINKALKDSKEILTFLKKPYDVTNNDYFKSLG